MGPLGYGGRSKEAGERVEGANKCREACSGRPSRSQVAEQGGGLRARSDHRLQPNRTDFICSSRPRGRTWASFQFVRIPALALEASSRSRPSFRWPIKPLDKLVAFPLPVKLMENYRPELV